MKSNGVSRTTAGLWRVLKMNVCALVAIFALGPDLCAAHTASERLAAQV
jgi:hypothetical protein